MSGGRRGARRQVKHANQTIRALSGRFCESPVFGLAGIILPENAVRPFATWFLQLKQYIFNAEIAASGKSASHWEKHGTAIYSKTVGSLSAFSEYWISIAELHSRPWRKCLLLRTRKDFRHHGGQFYRVALVVSGHISCGRTNMTIMPPSTAIFGIACIRLPLIAPYCRGEALNFPS
jgi:hypothetical protein